MRTGPLRFLSQVCTAGSDCWTRRRHSAPDQSVTIRVLILEDDASIASLLTRALSKWGFEVTLERNGDKGVERFEQGKFDVALVDGLLPGRNGFAVASRIRALPGGDKIGLVMMSAAFKNAQSKRDAHNAGFDAFYAKPFVVSQLREKLVELAKVYTGAELTPSTRKVPRAPSSTSPSGRSQPPNKRTSTSAEIPKAKAQTVVDDVDPLLGKAAPTAKNTPTTSSRVRVPHRPAFKVDSGSLALEERPIKDALDLPRTLLNLARSHATGVLSLQDQDGMLELAMLRGIVVGAWDNLRENVLAERLWRRHLLTAEQMQQLTEHIRATGDQVGEAVLTLGLLDEQQTLQQICLQARDRLLRAIGWNRGLLTFTADSGSVERMAVTTLDLVSCLLEHSLTAPDPRSAHALMTPRIAEKVLKTRDFEHGLVAFAHQRPASTLPMVFMMQPEPKLGQVLSDGGPDAFVETYAMWVAGMIRFEEDPATAARAVPVELSAEQKADEILDDDAVALVQRYLIRARGNSLYGLLKVADDAPTSVVKAAIDALRLEVGKDAIGRRRLGPARGSARELWALLDEAEATLLDDDRRRDYNAWVEEHKTPQTYRFTDDAERFFLDGRMALAQRGYAQAKDAFEEAVRKRPLNADYLAFLAWTQFLLDPEANAGNAEAVLQSANAVNPQAMRPHFFLGMLYRQTGRKEEAKSALKEALRRAPDDQDVLTAFESVA